ncbi:MAG: hypothetical protein V2B14_05225 [bacterium]
MVTRTSAIREYITVLLQEYKDSKDPGERSQIKSKAQAAAKDADSGGGNKTSSSDSGHGATGTAPIGHGTPDDRDEATQARDKGIIKDINEEFGTDSNDLYSFVEKAESGDSRIKILDKDGNVKDKYERGDVFEIQTKDHGTVKVQPGGDGAFDGLDDRVLSTGGETAAKAVHAAGKTTPKAEAQSSGDPGKPQKTHQSGGSSDNPNPYEDNWDDFMTWLLYTLNNQN